MVSYFHRYVGNSIGRKCDLRLAGGGLRDVVASLQGLGLDDDDDHTEDGWMSDSGGGRGGGGGGRGGSGDSEAFGGTGGGRSRGGGGSGGGGSGGAVEGEDEEEDGDNDDDDDDGPPLDDALVNAAAKDARIFCWTGCANAAVLIGAHSLTHTRARAHMQHALTHSLTSTRTHCPAPPRAPHHIRLVASVVVQVVISVAYYFLRDLLPLIFTLDPMVVEATANATPAAAAAALGYSMVMPANMVLQVWIRWAGLAREGGRRLVRERGPIFSHASLLDGR
jgi:hypothetical protein